MTRMKPTSGVEAKGIFILPENDVGCCPGETTIDATTGRYDIPHLHSDFKLLIGDPMSNRLFQTYTHGYQHIQALLVKGFRSLGYSRSRWDPRTARSLVDYLFRLQSCRCQWFRLGHRPMVDVAFLV
jgi:hypothetical protein